MKSYGVTIQMKATEQYFPVILIITLYKVYGSKLWFFGWNPDVWPFKRNLTAAVFPHRLMFFWETLGSKEAHML